MGSGKRMTSAEIALAWGDGRYSFVLKYKQIEELQRACGATFGAIVRRVLEDDYDVRDVVHTIRLGLIGGGLAPVKALELVEAYVMSGAAFADPEDPSSPLKTAKAVLLAANFGFKEAAVQDPKTPAAATDLSTSRPSEPSSSNSASTQEPSTT